MTQISEFILHADLSNFPLETYNYAQYLHMDPLESYTPSFQKNICLTVLELVAEDAFFVAENV